MANSQDKKTEEALPPVRISIIPFVVLIGLMTANLILDTIEVPSEMVLFLSTIVASLVAFFILKIPQLAAKFWMVVPRGIEPLFPG